MQGAFIQPLTYQPPVILGRRLHPFSCWHGFMMEAAGSPYIVGGIATDADVLYGTWVCSRWFCEGFPSVDDILAVLAWGQSYRRRTGLLWRLIGKESKGADLQEARAAFAEHIRLSLTSPDRWQSEQGSPLRAPLWWHLALFAREILHCSEDEAWDFPFSRLICYRNCKAETEGDKSLMTDEDQAGIRLLKKEAAADV